MTLSFEQLFHVIVLKFLRRNGHYNGIRPKREFLYWQGRCQKEDLKTQYEFLSEPKREPRQDCLAVGTFL